MRVVISKQFLKTASDRKDLYNFTGKQLSVIFLIAFLLYGGQFLKQFCNALLQKLAFMAMWLSDWLTVSTWMGDQLLDFMDDSANTTLQ